MIVVVGLGNLGGAMANRLVSCGRTVTGVDVSAESRSGLDLRHGSRAVAGLDRVEWRDALFVFVVVRLTSQVDDVLASLDELLRNRRRDDAVTVFISTTLDHEYARALERPADGPLRVIELPVAGGAGRARTGTLTALAAGPLSDAGSTLLTDTLVGRLFRFQSYGTPTAAKLANNCLAAYNARALAEMLHIASTLGVEGQMLLDVVIASSGDSYVAQHYTSLILDLLEKDADLLRRTAGGLPNVSLDPATFLASIESSYELLHRPVPDAGTT